MDIVTLYWLYWLAYFIEREILSTQVITTESTRKHSASCHVICHPSPHYIALTRTVPLRVSVWAFSFTGELLKPMLNELKSSVAYIACHSGFGWFLLKTRPALFLLGSHNMWQSKLNIHELALGSESRSDFNVVFLTRRKENTVVHKLSIGYSVHDSTVLLWLCIVNRNNNTFHSQRAPEKSSDDPFKMSLNQDLFTAQHEAAYRDSINPDKVEWKYFS